MKVKNLVSLIETVIIIHPDIVVENTAAKFLLNYLAPGASVVTKPAGQSECRCLRIGVLISVEALGKICMPCAYTRNSSRRKKMWSLYSTMSNRLKPNE